MHAFGIVGTAAALLTTTLFLAGPASADRICRQVCDGGFCKSRCVDRGSRLYMHEEHWRDRHEYNRPSVELYRRGGIEHHRPGVEVDINR